MLKRKGSEIGDAEHPDATYVMTRAEDRSPWMRFSYLTEKYRPLVWLAALILVSAGYGFKTPRSANAELGARVDSLATRVIAIERVAVNLDALIRIKCVENVERPDVMQLAGIDCKSWLNTSPRNALP